MVSTQCEHTLLINGIRNGLINKVIYCKCPSLSDLLTSSPFLTAVVFIPATSDPQSGSVTQYDCK